MPFYPRPSCPFCPHCQGIKNQDVQETKTEHKTCIVKCRVHGTTNTHSGYCTDNECNLEQIDEDQEFSVTFTPENYEEFTREVLLSIRAKTPISTLEPFTEIGIDEDLAWTYFYLNLARLERLYAHEGSGYCRNSEHSEKQRVDKHEVVLEFTEFQVIFKN